jgi:serine/threonine protein kinase
MREGDVIGGRFELIARQGRGGSSEVFRARDQASQQEVAVKLGLRPEPHCVRRFEREAAVLAALRSPAIVRYIAHGTTDSGAQFLVMEWLPGGDLASRLARSCLSLCETLRLGQELAQALEVIHAAGIVHRDLTPTNIGLVDASALGAKLLDFGVARVQGASTVTRVGTVLGTPGYLAPEQINAPDSVDGRADLFALACVLHECLSGRPVFSAETHSELFARILFSPAPAIPSAARVIPEALAELLDGMLAKDPARRPGSAREVARALARIEGADRGEGAHADPQARACAVSGRTCKTCETDLCTTGAGTRPSPARSAPQKRVGSRRSDTMASGPVRKP